MCVTVLKKKWRKILNSYQSPINVIADGTLDKGTIKEITIIILNKDCVSAKKRLIALFILFYF